MKLNYNILWIDDRADAVEPVKIAIKDYLSERGFDLQVVYHKDGSRIMSMISKPDIDLIILDQNLSKKSGEELAKSVRSKEKYIEIILYSQDPQTDLKGIISGLDGVYRTHRDKVEEVIQKVIDRTIKKTQDLNVMRGLVISESIDIENQVEAVMVKCFKKSGGFFRKKVLEKNVYDFARKVHFLNSIVNDRIQWLQSRKTKTETIANKLEQLKKISAEIKKIEKEVLDPRNILAHSTVKYRSSGKAYLKGINSRTPEIKFDHDWCKQMRKDLLKHSKYLEQISTII